MSSFRAMFAAIAGAITTPVMPEEISVILPPLGSLMTVIGAIGVMRRLMPPGRIMDDNPLRRIKMKARRQHLRMNPAMMCRVVIATGAEAEIDTGTGVIMKIDYIGMRKCRIQVNIERPL
jgi:hypothetical protein